MSGSAILRALLFRLHGQALSSPPTTLWLFVSWVMAVLISSSEAGVAFVVARLYGLVTPVAIGASVTAFLFVFLIDMQLVLMDTSERSGSTWFQRRGKTTAAFVGRCALFTISLAVSSAAILVCVFRDEVDVEHAEQLVAAEDAANIEKTRYLAARIDSVTKSVAEAYDRYENEANGRKGGSGLMGVGSRAQLHLKDRDAARNELEAAKKDANEFKRSVDSLPDSFSRARMLLLSKPELTFRERIVRSRSMLSLPGGWQKFALAECYIVFAFLAILILKLLAPESVRVYLSEVLQQDFQEWASGKLDGLLKFANLPSHPKDLSPLDFKAFCEDELPKIKRSFADDRTRAPLLRAADDASRELSRIESEYDAARTAAQRATERHRRARLQVAKLDVAWKACQMRLTQLLREREELDRNVDPSIAISVSSELRRQQAALMSLEIERIEATDEAETSQVEQTEAAQALAAVTKTRDFLRARLADIERKITESSYSRAVSDRTNGHNPEAHEHGDRNGRDSSAEPSFVA